MLDVGKSTVDVGEQTVGETTRKRNDCYSQWENWNENLQLK